MRQVRRTNIFIAAASCPRAVRRRRAARRGRARPPSTASSAAQSACAAASSSGTPAPSVASSLVDLDRFGRGRRAVAASARRRPGSGSGSHSTVSCRRATGRRRQQVRGDRAATTRAPPSADQRANRGPRPPEPGGVDPGRVTDLVDARAPARAARPSSSGSGAKRLLPGPAVEPRNTTAPRTTGGTRRPPPIPPAITSASASAPSRSPR